MGTGVRNESKAWKFYHSVMARLAAVGFLLLGLRWLYVFIFTDYRAHHRPVMIPLALLVVAFSVGLFYLKRLFILMLILLSLFGFLGSLYIQIKFVHYNPFWLAIAVTTFVYLIVFALYAYRSHDRR